VGSFGSSSNSTGTPAPGNKKANRYGSPFIPFQFQLLVKPALALELVELSVYLIT
jgi:hypothetical protein